MTLKEFGNALLGRPYSSDETLEEYTKTLVKAMHKKYGFVLTNRVLLRWLKEYYIQAEIPKEFIKNVSTFQDHVAWRTAISLAINEEPNPKLTQLPLDGIQS